MTLTRTSSTSTSSVSPGATSCRSSTNLDAPPHVQRQPGQHSPKASEACTAGTTVGAPDHPIPLQTVFASKRALPRRQTAHDHAVPPPTPCLERQHPQHRLAVAARRHHFLLSQPTAHRPDRRLPPERQAATRADDTEWLPLPQHPTGPPRHCPLPPTKKPNNMATLPSHAHRQCKCK